MKRHLIPSLTLVLITIVTVVMGCNPASAGGGAGNGPSTNADLSALTVSSGTLSPAFAAATTNYAVTAANTATTVTVTGTKADTSASVDAPQTLSNLVVGVAQTATITVTAQSGATKAYTVAVTRAASVLTNADLSALTVDSGTLTPAFDPATTSYTVGVANAVATITVDGTKADASASVGVNPAQPSSLVGGANPITVTVTAGDTVTTKAYTVTVTRAAPAAPTGVTATPISTTAIDISWSAVAGATSYNLYWSTTSGVGKSGTKLAGVTSVHHDTGLTIGTPYYYVVTALNSGGESIASTQVSATPAAFINAQFIVNAADGTGVQEAVSVTDGGGAHGPAITSGVTATLNGTPLLYNSGKGDYEGSVTIVAGAAVNLSVTVNGIVYTASTTQYTTFPTVTSPTSGATWTASNSNSINWNAGSPTAGAEYLVGVVTQNFSTWAYGSGSGPSELSTSIHSAAVGAGSIPAGTYYVLVGMGPSGMMENTGGIVITNALPNSFLAVGAANLIPITVQ